jgi:enoyl-CoA hydratase/carnithine racemase
VARRSRFDDYRDRYDRWFRLEKSDDGVLLVQLHTDGGEFVWDLRGHGAFADLLADIAGDRDLSAVIITGTGETFMARTPEPRTAKQQPLHVDLGPEALDEIGWTGIQLHLNLLDVQVPVIAAVNGPCTIHPELAVMCDIVLLSETACFQDSPHFARGVVPGDGAHTVWPLVIGRNRANYFLVSGQRLSASQALEYGAVHEVLPPDRLLPRAREIADHLALRPPMTLRLTRSILNQALRRAAVDDLRGGVYQELLAMGNFLSWRDGLAPLDRAWDDDPWGEQR